jgi:hypothetical protein
MNKKIIKTIYHIDFEWYKNNNRIIEKYRGWYILLYKNRFKEESIIIYNPITKQTNAQTIIIFDINRAKKYIDRKIDNYGINFILNKKNKILFNKLEKIEDRIKRYNRILKELEIQKKELKNKILSSGEKDETNIHSNNERIIRI